MVRARLHAFSLVALLWLALGLGPAVARAQNYQVLHESLDSSRRGYTVLRVWGTDYQMGEAQGRVLAADIVAAVAEVTTRVGSNYPTLKGVVATMNWQAVNVDDELAGMVAGVKAAIPSATLDVGDLKVLNTYADWAYACRSHAAWGSWVVPPVKTLSTRRLDFANVFDMMLHHVVVVHDPSTGAPRYVTVAAPGAVVVATGVNAHGALTSLHNDGGKFNAASHGVPRGLASRHLLVDVGARPLAQQLAWAQGELSTMTVATSGFINYFVPMGGGVFSCASGGPCSVRLPQADLYGGEVIITTNTDTDGHSVPPDGLFLADYYNLGKPKTLKDHFEVMGSSGVHLLSVAYRGEEDMTLWVLGRGRTDRLEYEWKDLFAGTVPLPDGGTPASDAGVQPDAGVSQVDGGGSPDASVGAPPTDAGISSPPPAAVSGCGCSSPGADPWLLSVLGLVAGWAGRRARRPLHSSHTPGVFRGALACGRADHPAT